MSTFVFGDYKINVPFSPSQGQGSEQGSPQGSVHKNTKNKKSSTNVNSSRKSQVIITQPALTPASQIYKESNSVYENGVTSQAYTFYNTNDAAPLLKQTLTQREGGTLLDSLVDFTVAGIKGINRKSESYKDSYYNIIEKHRVFASFSPRVQESLKFIRTLDGEPIKESFSDSFKRSLVLGEDANFSVCSIDNLRDVQSNSALSVAPSEKVYSAATDNSNAISLIRDRSVSLNPDDYQIKTKNRLLTWWSLAEDLNKRVVFKTSDLVETNIYIPNVETLTVKASTGKEYTLSMQAGDYFIAKPLQQDQRLTVFSDRDRAKTVSDETKARVLHLLNEPRNIDVEFYSDDSDLVEYDLDTTGVRQDYYFLQLDKATLEEEGASNQVLRRTKATYNYITTGIDEYIQYRAFPNLTFFVLNDDIGLNHLEVTEKAVFTFTNVGLDGLDTGDNVVWPQKIPPWIIIVPTDVTENTVFRNRSRSAGFSTRKADLIPSPNRSLSSGGLRTPFAIESSIVPEGVNFGTDTENNVVYQESIQYQLNTEDIIQTERYSQGSEVIPRKEPATTKVLKEINTIKDSFSLNTRDSINSYDLYSRLEPQVLRGINLDQINPSIFKSKLRYNKLSTDASLTSKLVSIKDTSVLSVAGPTLLDTGGSDVITNKGNIPVSKDAGTGKTNQPVVRPEGSLSY